MASKKPVIALMVGHGISSDKSWDSGCVYGKYTEADLMLYIVKKAASILRDSGITVLTDADYSNNRNMIASVAWANNNKCDYYISVHCDYSQAPTGVMPLYVSSKGKALANALNSAIKSGMGMKTRGVVKRTDLYELNYTDMPAVILETGAIKADLNKLKLSDAYGRSIAKGICNFLGVTYSEKVSTPVEKTEEKTSSKLVVDGEFGPKSIAAAGKWAGVAKPTDKFAGQQKSQKSYIPAIVDYCTWTGSGSATVKAIQKKVGSTADGVLGKDTVTALQKFLNKSNYGLTVDGVWGVATSKAFQRYLNGDIPTAKTTKTVTTTKKTTTTTVKKTTKATKSYKASFIAALKDIASILIKEKFKYRNSGKNKSTLASARKNAKYSNCADYVSWSLQRCGILPSGKKIWLNSKINGSGRSYILKAAKQGKLKITYTKKVPSKCGLEVGDICGFSSGPHTMVYLGDDKWASAGGSDFKAKKIYGRSKSSYNKKKVRVIIRLT